MFRGVTSLNLDAKGRLAVPSRHRDALFAESAGRVVLTAHPHGCLQAKIMSLSSFDRQSSALQRLLVGYAEDLELDSSGRLLVSPALREFVGLEKQAMLVGQGSHFELWSTDGWKTQLEKVMAGDGMELPAELEGFSL